MKWFDISWRVLAAWVGLLVFSSGQAVVAAEYRHFDWKEVAPGIWFGSPLPNSFQGGNVTIITLPDGGSMVVDTQNSETLGREILVKAKEVGAGPVKYVVNTHLHQDHVGGNVAFQIDNPNVRIFAHRNTCDATKQRTVPRFTDRLPGLIKGLDEMRARRASLPDGDKVAGAALDRRIQGTELYLGDTKAFKWAMPNVCLDLKPGDAEIINESGRHIEIRYHGRAHSTGDLVVFLPKEKVAVVGDLWGANSGHAFLDAGLDGREGSVLETPHTLKSVRTLDFDIVLAGHAPPMHGKASLNAAIASGERIIAQVKGAADRGETIAAVLRRMPPPANTPLFYSEAWTSVVVRAFEEIELRRQLGIALPGEVLSKP
jgi:cyclase